MRACLTLLGVLLAGCSANGDYSCGQVAPCGGNVVGNWTIVSSCAGFTDPAQQSDISGVCNADGPSGGTTFGQTGSIAGTWSFTGSLTFSLSVMSTISAEFSCTGNLTCSELDTAAKGMQGSDATIQSIGCKTASGGGCLCAITNVATQMQTGTYSTAGSTLTLSDGSSIDYCVQGNTLHWIRNDMVTASPYPDTVLVRM